MLQVQNIWKSFENQPLLKGISFDLAEGETLCLLGRSGSGKSTLLRIIAGLEQPEEGRVLWDGVDQARVPVHLRGFSLMFQDYALFPHRSVAENVAFGLRMQNARQADIDARVSEMLETVHMTRFADRRVTDLSGGEQQRVALARALAPKPRLLMLDEPLGALDRALREQLIRELREVLHTSGIPAIYVTHDQEEAFTLADRILLLHAGQVEQSGAPTEVYRHPASPWVATFLGQTNLLPGMMVSPTPARVRTDWGEFITGETSPRPAGSPVTVLIPRAGALIQTTPGSQENRLQGRVEDCIFQGETYLVEVRCQPDCLMFFDLPHALDVGAAVTLTFDTARILVLGEQPHG